MMANMRSWRKALICTISTLFLSGCFGLDSSGTTAPLEPRLGWVPGNQWLYVDSGGVQEIETTLLNDQLHIDGSPVYLMSWKEKSSSQSHLVAMNEVNLGRYREWVDPLVIKCRLATDCKSDAEFDIQISDDSVFGPLSILDFGAGNSTDLHEVDHSRIDSWIYKGMIADLDVHIFNRHETFSSPYLGQLSVIHLEYRFSVIRPSAAFQSYAEARMQKDGVDIMHFNASAEYSRAQRNLVHAKASGGDGPGEVFGAGVIFAGGKDTADEYWLKSFNPNPGKTWSRDELLARWGGPLQPAVGVPFTIYEGNVPKEIKIDANGKAVNYAFYIQQSLKPIAYPAHDSIEYVLKDSAGAVLVDAITDGAHLKFVPDANQLRFNLTYRNPGNYTLSVKASKQSGELWDEKTVPGIRVTLSHDLNVTCVVGLNASVASCPSLAFPPGKTGRLNATLEVKNGISSSGRVRLTDARGATILDEAISGPTWRGTVDAQTNLDVSGDWQLSWIPDPAVVQGAAHYSVRWTP